MIDLARLCRQLHALFAATAATVARQTMFARRDSEPAGSLFRLILVTGFPYQPTGSPNSLAQVAGDLGVSIARQSLHQHLPVRLMLRGLSLTKALRLVRRWVPSLARALTAPEMLKHVIYSGWTRFGSKDSRRKELGTCRQRALATRAV